MTVAYYSATDSVNSPSGAAIARPDKLPDYFQLPLIALDIGMKRIGVAVSDRLGLSCRGLACLQRRDRGWRGQLNRLIGEYGCKGIVAGLPKNMDGTEGAQARDARAAVAELVQATQLPIVFQDERLSTWAAKERLFAEGLSEKKVRSKLDQTAAAVILEDFLCAHPEIMVHGAKNG